MFLTCGDGCHEKTCLKESCDAFRLQQNELCTNDMQRRLTDDRQTASTAIPSITGLKAVNTQNGRVAIHAAKHNASHVGTVNEDMQSCKHSYLHH